MKDRELKNGGKRVQYKGIPGTTVMGLSCQMEREMADLYEKGLAYPYNVIVLSVGGNDLCNAQIPCERFVSDLSNLAQTLVTRFGVTKVILCQILHRAKYHPRFMKGLTLAHYNARVDAANSLLHRQFANTASTGNIVYWSHHKSCLGASQLSWDGVHLNDHGMKGYRRSIEFALQRHGRA